MTTRVRTRRPRGRPVVRTWRDAVLAAVGAGLLVLTAVPIHRHSISVAETHVFRALNDHTVLPFVVVWPIMQLGNFVVVPVAAAVAAIFRRWRLAFAMLAAGAATYYLAKVVKGIVVRGRPSDLLDDVTIRGAAALGRGYVSGHAAVVTLLVALVWPYLTGRWRWVAVAAAVFVCLSRVYVAAHLPLDVLGGAALGLTVGGIARLVFGRPPP
jgi:membrane-associated phospholipid phosphatase